MGVLVQDLKYALRQLSASPGFTLVCVLVLGLGIGANTAVFSVVDAVLLDPLPYAEGDRLVLVRHEARASGISDIPFSVLDLRDYREQSRTFERMEEYHSMWFTLLGRDEPQRLQTGVVSAGFFDLLGITPVIGRSFLPEDAEAGAPAVMILSHEYWQQELGADPGVIGRTFEMNDRIHTVVGVLPPVPQFADENQLYMTTEACPVRSSEDVESSRTSRMLQVLARLEDGVTLEQARTDVGLIVERLAAEYPEAYEGYSATVTSLRDHLVGDSRPTLLVLLGTVALVLLITCANLANLTFARVLRRDKELAVRAAMGADRRRLTRQLLTESTLLALLGAAAGLLLATSTLDLLSTFVGRYTPRAAEIRIDAGVLFFTLGVAVVTGLAVGLVPALSGGSDKTASVLREGSGRGTGSRRANRIRAGLIVVEVAVAFVLLIGAGLMVRTVWKLGQVDAGFETENVLSVEVHLDWRRHTDRQQIRDFFSSLLERARALPGVESAAVAATFPLNEAAAMSSDFTIEGQDSPDDRERPRADYRVVSPGYFETLGIPLLGGRLFTEADHEDAARVAIVNQAVARRYWGERDPVGLRIALGGGTRFRTIVGVVGNVRHQGLANDVPDEIYLPFRQSPMSEMNLLLRSAGDPLQLARPVSRAVFALDPEQPVARIRTLDQVLRQSLASPRLVTVLLALFAALALLIAAAGIGGVIAFAVNQQTREIGLRMALGARRSDVLRAVLGQAMALVAAGLAIGAVGALFLARILSGLLFDVAPTDLVTYLGVSVLLAAVALAACLVPARRATLVDPVVALRCE